SCMSVSENLLRHQFTHFSLDISVANIELGTLPGKISDNQNIKLVPYNRLAEFGLPTPVRKILNQI
ncbi:MAG: NUDIX domain-containing protein, partial [Gammaproteobacteria bacterium]|nr:NUDIX domain-containing protein [Gammaproteobacteria bacterium]